MPSSDLRLSNSGLNVENAEYVARTTNLSSSFPGPSVDNAEIVCGISNLSSKILGPNVENNEYVSGTTNLSSNNLDQSGENVIEQSLRTRNDKTPSGHGQQSFQMTYCLDT